MRREREKRKKQRCIDLGEYFGGERVPSGPNGIWSPQKSNKHAWCADSHVIWPFDSNDRGRWSLEDVLCKTVVNPGDEAVCCGSKQPRTQTSHPPDARRHLGHRVPKKTNKRKKSEEQKNLTAKMRSVLELSHRMSLLKRKSLMWTRFRDLLRKKRAPSWRGKWPVTQGPVTCT